MPEARDFHAACVRFVENKAEFYVIGGSDKKRTKLTTTFKMEIKEFLP